MKNYLPFKVFILIIFLFEPSHAKVYEKRILVTGAAGFIGFHLAKSLSSDKTAYVVAFDNFNDYYNTSLKKERAYELNKLGVRFYLGDLCDGKFLRNLFTQHSFTHLANFAAQAGVRHSIVDPYSYVRENVECHSVLLNQIKNHPPARTIRRFVHSSSSSVYGKHSSVPFRENSNVNNPGNMYAATKRTGELLNEKFTNVTDNNDNSRPYNNVVSVINLRYFTVYGPYGRPDMAVTRFANDLIDGKTLRVFGNGMSLERDFTYVDDIIEGIRLAINYEGQEQQQQRWQKSVPETFNLGFGKSQKLQVMISLLEEYLGKKAKIRYVPVPKSEILHTWADITKAKEILNFQPTIDLKNGIRKYIAWMKSYKPVDKKSIDKFYSNLIRDKLRRDRLEEIENQDQPIPKINNIYVKINSYDNSIKLPIKTKSGITSWIRNILASLFSPFLSSLNTCI